MKYFGSFYKRLLKNSSKLLSGSFIASILNLLALSFTSKHLGANQLGLLVIAQTFVIVIDNIVNFQPWQALIKYGINNKNESNTEGFKAIIKITFLIDAGTALFAFVIAQVIHDFIIEFLSWDEEVSYLIKIYAFVILTNLKSLSIGVLRIYNQYGHLSIVNVLVSIVRILGVLLLVYLEGTIVGFLILWLLCEVLNNTLLFLLCLKELRKNTLLDFLQSSTKNFNKINKGYFKFVITSNVHSTIRQLSREIDILIVGTYLAPSDVGIFKIVKNLTKPLLKIIDPFYQVIYPELVSFYEDRKFHEFLSVIRNTTLFSSILMIISYIIFFFTGYYIIDLLFGGEFIYSKKILDFYLIAISIAIATFSWQPAMLASGQAPLSLKIQIISTIVYYVVLFFLISNFALIGVSIAYIMYYVVWVTLMAYSFRKLKYKK